MSFFTIFVMAVALAADAFAVAVTSGVQLVSPSFSQTLRMALAFGFFQGAMPVIGWFCGREADAYLLSYDHWVAFGLLCLVGVNMLREAWNKRNQPAQTDAAATDPTTGATLVLLGVATSIDALAVGVSLGVMGYGVWLQASVIGIVCCLLTAVGLHLGKYAHLLAGNLANRANAIAGFVLIAIGLNILRQHGTFV